MTMPTFRTLTGGLLATLALAVAGCGGDGGASGVSSESGAHLVRSGVLAFVSIDSDLGSGQWQQVDTLSKKFPGRSKAIAQLKQSISSEGVDYDQDVKPALGP